VATWRQLKIIWATDTGGLFLDWSISSGIVDGVVK
jgi:hypothetical protein